MQRCAENALLPEACVNASLTPEECLDPEDCAYLFHYWNLSDVTVGVILIVFSILLLCCSLIGMVKLLTSLLQGAMAIVVRKVINPKFDNAIGNYLYGYFNIIIGAVLTFCVQSSSVFTSALTPLVGIGLISVSIMGFGYDTVLHWHFVVGGHNLPPLSGCQHRNHDNIDTGLPGGLGATVN